MRLPGRVGMALVALLAALPAFALCPSPTGGSPPVAPTRPAYLALLAELGRDFASRLGTGAEALDRVLEESRHDGAGSNAAMPLSMMGGARAAVHATIWSCRRQPDSALFASNLGSLLDGVGDPRAGQVLAYAVTLSPGTILPRLNLGWLQFHRGDLAAAKASFGAASRTAPRSGAVLLGLGMVAHCEGDHRLAADLLSRALSQVSSRAAEQALDESRAQQGEEPPASPGDITIPRRDDSTRGVRPGRVAVAEPYLPGSNDALLKEGLARNAAIVAAYDDRTKEWVARQQRLDPNTGRGGPPVRTATSVTLLRSDDAMAALAHAQYAAYAARIRAVRAPFERDFEAQKDRVSSRVQDILAEAQAQPAQVLAVFCPAAKAALEQEYGRFRAIWRGTWEAERKLIREYGETAGATISQVRHDDLRTYLDIDRQLHVIAWGLDGPGDVIGWGTIGGAVMVCGEPAAPAPKGTVDPSDDAGKAPCPPFLQSGLGFDCVVASVTLDCEKIAFQGGEGIMGRFEHNYVTHEQTFWLGVGVDLKAGVGPWSPGGEKSALNAGIEGSVGAFITTGEGGQFRDFGYTASAGAAAGPFSMGAGLTVGAIGGPSTSSSATFNVGPASVGVP